MVGVELCVEWLFGVVLVIGNVFIVLFWLFELVDEGVFLLVVVLGGLVGFVGLV